MSKSRVPAIPLALGAAIALAHTTPAHATPAEVLLVLDTSASMLEPSDDGGETKFERAKEIVADLATTLGDRGHRVALFRFRQKTVTVMTGQGLAEVQAEDENQCQLATDLVVPMEPGSGSEIVRWVNGIDDDTDPEVVALGDSPLYNTTRAVLGFVRGRRLTEPTQNCVNAVVVFVTDGSDTCVAGADLINYQNQLRAQTVEEDIRAYVVSFKPESETSQLLARMGHTDETGFPPFSFVTADDLVTALGSLQGRPSPEACLVSGVPAEQIFPDGVPEGFKDPREKDPETTQGTASDEDGCQTGGAAPTTLLTLLLTGAVLAMRRRRRAVLALLASLVLAACGDDGDGMSGTDTTDPDTTEVMGPDPTALAAAVIADQAALLDAIPEIRDTLLRPHFDPTLKFDAIAAGDALAGCLDLARSVGYTQSRFARRGPAGCLGTNQCNSIDHALLAQACLDHHGITAVVEQCRPSSTWETRTRALAEQRPDPRSPSIQPAIDALRAKTDAVLGGDPEGLQALADGDAQIQA